MDRSAHSIWQELSSAALVGGERRALPISGASGKLGAVLTGVSEQVPDPDQALLTAAGVLSLYRRAGFEPARAEAPLSEPCPADDRPATSLRSSDHLVRMLSEQKKEVLAEWLSEVAHRGRRVRDQDLVPLLEQGRGQRELREAIVAVIGRRGRWLAAQNPDWSYAVGAGIAVGDWQTDSRDARIATLKHLRATDPDCARERVASTWDQDPPAERAAFLETFAAGLSVEDEPFLEAALDDRRAEVRRAAAGLLSRLAPSRLCQRMIDRCGNLVRFTDQAGKLVVELILPEQYTKEMARDGVDKKAQGMGEKQAWLAQMIGIVPPDHWCQASDRMPSELLGAAARSEWKTLLLGAWTQAARRHLDQSWLEALLADLYARGFADAPGLPQLFMCLPRERQEQVVVELLWSSRGAQANLAEMLARVDRPWGPELSHAVIAFVQREAAAGSDLLQWVVPQLLRVAATRMPPSFVEEVAEKLAAAFNPPRHLTEAFTGSLELLHFRHQMLSELQS